MTDEASEKPRLDSWKDIARYLGRDVRTVARWERQRALPVYRVPGGRRSHVFAYAEELDAWLAQGNASPEAGAAAPEPVSTPPHPAVVRGWHVITGAMFCFLLVGAGWALTRPADPPRRLTIAGNELLAHDASGRTRWTHRFEASEVLEPAGRWSYIGDLNRDGRDDVLATLEVTGTALDQHGGELFRFSEGGDVQWTSKLEDRVTFRGAEYGPPWAATDLSVYQAGDETRLAWIAHHFTWWPGLLVTLNAAGDRLGTFVNSGWISTATASPDGRSLLVSGITNSRHAYFLAVLDAGNPSGHSPEPPGSDTECLTCPAGDPLYYFVFPRTDVGRAQAFPVDGPSLQTFTSGATQVQTHETAAPNIAAAIYNVTADFTIREAGFSDSFWERHRRLEQEGTLSHRAEDCPERAGLDVQRWTRAEGWTSLRVPVR